MIATDFIASRVDTAAAAARAHTEAFFDAWGVDRHTFETFLLRSFQGELTPYYVSTVARGLASSTSDVDVIVVTDDPRVRRTPLSSMLFYADRRVGAKVVSRCEIRSALALIGKELERWEADGRCADVTLPLKWVDLERVVNGATFVGDPEFLYALPDVSQWTTIRSRRNFVAYRFYCTLAVRAGRLGAARIYAEAAVAAAMDTVLAICGDVQWNTKWTFERWRRLLAADIPAEVAETARAIDAAHLRILAASTPQAKAGAADVLAALGESGPLPGTVDGARLALGREVAVHAFLPSAQILQTSRGALVLDTATLAACLEIDGAGLAQLTPETARAVLELAQQGYLRLTHKDLLDA
jgi:hypothetical protein